MDGVHWNEETTVGQIQLDFSNIRPMPLNKKAERRRNEEEEKVSHNPEVLFMGNSEWSQAH